MIVNNRMKEHLKWDFNADNEVVECFWYFVSLKAVIAAGCLSVSVVYMCVGTGTGTGVHLQELWHIFNTWFCFASHQWLYVYDCVAAVYFLALFQCVFDCSTFSFISFTILLNYEPFLKQVYCVLWLAIFFLCFFHHLTANIVERMNEREGQVFDGCVVHTFSFCPFSRCVTMPREHTALTSLLKCHCFGFCWTLCENI